MLARDGKHPLDDDVVQGKALRKKRLVLGLTTQGAGDAIEFLEDLLESPCQIRVDRPEGRCGIRSKTCDLPHEAIEEDMMTGLIDDLGSQEDAFGETVGSIQNRCEVARDGLLPHQEQ